MAVGKYEHHDGWRRYQPYLPARLRLTDTDLPREERWDWEGLELHLDRYDVANACGLTGVPRQRFTYETWVACARDLAVAELERSDRPVIALGGSMGGMLAWHAAAAGAPLAGIAATTLIDSCGHYPLEETWVETAGVRVSRLRDTASCVKPSAGGSAPGRALKPDLPRGRFARPAPSPAPASMLNRVSHPPKPE